MLKLLSKYIQQKLEGSFGNNTFVSIGWLTIDKTIRLIIGIITGTWMARYLGPTEFGQLSYVLVYISFFQVIASFSLDGIVIRELTKNRADTEAILGTSFILKLSMGSLCWITALIICGASHGWNTNELLLVGLIGSGLFFQSADVIDSWLQSTNKIKYAVIAKLLSYCISNTFKVILILNQAPMTAFGFAIAIDFILMAAFLSYAYNHHSRNTKWVVSIRKCRELIKWSSPLCIAAIIGLMQARIEFLFIEKILGLEDVGQYSAALRWIELFSLPGIIITTAVYPTLAASKNHTDLMIQKIYFLVNLVFIATIPLMLIAWLLMDVLYGPEYIVAKSIFIFMIFRPILAYIGTVRSMAIKIDKMTWYDLFCAIIGAVIAITAAPVFIKSYGIVGAVLSAYLSYTISNVLIDIIFYKRNFKNFTRSFLFFIFWNSNKT